MQNTFETTKDEPAATIKIQINGKECLMAARIIERVLFEENIKRRNGENRIFRYEISANTAKTGKGRMKTLEEKFLDLQKERAAKRAELEAQAWPRYVWVVSTFSDGDSEATVSVFDNEAAAIKAKKLLSNGRNRCALDKCPVCKRFLAYEEEKRQ